MVWPVPTGRDRQLCCLSGALQQQPGQTIHPHPLTWYFKDLEKLEMQVIVQQLFRKLLVCFPLSVCGCCRVITSTTGIASTHGCCYSTPVPCANAASSVSSRHSIRPSFTTLSVVFDLCRFLNSQLTAGGNASVLGSLWLKLLSPCHWWMWSEICFFCTNHTHQWCHHVPGTPVHYCNKVRC